MGLKTNIPSLRPARLSLAILAVSLMAGCAITPKPLQVDQARQTIQQDLSRMFSRQEAINGALTLDQAIARAIKYNLDGRLQLMEQAMAAGQLDLSRFEMLPRIALSAGYMGRTNESASSSESIQTRQQSLEPSTSLDRDRQVADLTIAWNVLDFGVSYYSAQQNADRSLILEERRRKVIQNTVQQVSAAYWRAVAAERLITRIDPLMERVRQARSDSATLESLRLRSPLEALNYQRSLLESLSRLEAQRKELALAKTELAALISLQPGQTFELAIPADTYEVPQLTVDMAQLEELALGHRPELREEHYQSRIGALEARKALLRMLPGIEFNLGGHYDSNSYLENNRWADYSAKVTWNLLNVLSAPANLDYAEANEQVIEARRQAMSMAVLTQLHVARANFQESVRLLDTAKELHAIDTRILEQQRAAASTRRVGDLALIQSELNAVQAALALDLQYADVRAAFNQIFLSLGADPVPEIHAGADVQSLSEVVRNVAESWQRGEVKL